MMKIIFSPVFFFLFSRTSLFNEVKAIFNFLSKKRFSNPDNPRRRIGSSTLPKDFRENIL